MASFEEALQRAEQLMRSCEGWPRASPTPSDVPERETWPPQQPPSANDAMEATFAALAGLSAAAKQGVKASNLQEDLALLRSGISLDSLERENNLLRQQLERYAAREKGLKATVEELQRALRSQAQAVHEQEQRRSAQQHEAAAQAAATASEALRSETAVLEQRLSAMTAEVRSAEEDIRGITMELWKIQLFVLPNAPAPHSLGKSLESPLKASVQAARHAASELRLACEAKMETMGLIHQQLRNRLGAASQHAPAAARSLTDEGAKATSSTNNAGHELLALQREASDKLEVLKEELQQARQELEEERSRSAKALLLESEMQSSQVQIHKDLESLRRSLRLKEAEVKELQLTAKYFPGQRLPTQQELSVADLADELRSRCSRLSAEVSTLRSERDFLRAEQAHSKRVAGLPSRQSPGDVLSPGFDFALATSIWEGKASVRYRAVRLE